jgi:hypothetical protein
MGVPISPNGVRRVGRRALEKVDHGIPLTRKENRVVLIQMAGLLNLVDHFASSASQ